MTQQPEIHPPLRRITYLGADLAHFAPAADRAYYTLDPNVRYLWIISRGISWTILLGGMAVSIAITGMARAAITPWLIKGMLVLLPLAVLSIVWPLIAYKHWGLAIREHDMLVRNGVLFKHVASVPFTRIQHVDTHSGPIERSFGLATLIVHTAGSQLGSLTVPGLPQDEAQQLRDYLSKAGHTHANL
ncbi:MAG: PH domain-containing protein [Acidobacteria bacterium]|nr:PH domain-containing protein [Acidobacteriota bacterium]